MYNGVADIDEPTQELSDVAQKRKQSKPAKGRPPTDGTGKPASLNVRLKPDDKADFDGELEKMEPAATATAVVEMLIRRWVRERRQARGEMPSSSH